LREKEDGVPRRSSTRKTENEGAALDDDESRARAARSFWSGTITFGLVSIPVNLYSAYRSVRSSLRTLGPDGTPLARRYFCAKDQEEVSGEEIVRGYELGEGRYVPVTDEELEALEPKRSRDIELSRFVDVSAISPRLFEQAYFLAPDGKAVRAYQLLVSVMEEERKAGIATFVMRGKEHLVAIFSDRGVLLAVTLRFADEVRSARDVGVRSEKRAPASQASRFREAIRRHGARKLDEKALRDEHWGELQTLAEKKAARGKDVVEVSAGADGAEGSPATTNVIDLMEILKQRLAGAEPKDPPRKTSSRSSRARAPRSRRSTHSGKRALRKAS
jgi:DNA end-binding protein Ku